MGAQRDVLDGAGDLTNGDEMVCRWCRLNIYIDYLTVDAWEGEPDEEGLVGTAGNFCCFDCLAKWAVARSNTESRAHEDAYDEDFPRLHLTEVSRDTPAGSALVTLVDAADAS